MTESDVTLADFLVLLARRAGALCTCCANTEHRRDKTGKRWVVPVRDALTHRLQAVTCRRCSKPCANARCAQLPPNPDGRGYGVLPRRSPTPLSRIRARARL